MKRISSYSPHVCMYVRVYYSRRILSFLKKRRSRLSATAWLLYVRVQYIVIYLYVYVLCVCSFRSPDQGNVARYFFNFFFFLSLIPTLPNSKNSKHCMYSKIQYPQNLASVSLVYTNCSSLILMPDDENFKNGFIAFSHFYYSFSYIFLACLRSFLIFKEI